MKKFIRVLACACALLLAIGSLTGCFSGKKKLPDKPVSYTHLTLPTT